MAESDIQENRIKNFFSNPLVGTIGTVTTILGVALSIYFYFQSKEERELAFSINPIRSTVVKAGSVSDIKVLFGDKPVTSDISIAQIAIWNRGNLSIKKDNILAPISISISNKTPILEAKVVNLTRDITAVGLNRNSEKEGVLGVLWSILEENDGALIQITYAGPQELPISVSGVIEGQKSIDKVEGTNESDIKKMAPLYAIFGSALIYAVILFVDMVRKGKKGNLAPFLGLLVWGILLYFVRMAVVPKSPFGF